MSKSTKTDWNDVHCANGSNGVRAVFDAAAAAPGASADNPQPEIHHRFRLMPFSQIRVGTTSAYLVKQLIPRGGLTVVWGPPKCGKSFWAFDTAMHVALGREYCARRVNQGAVVYCAFEGADGFKKRVEAFRQTRMADGEKNPPFFLLAARVNLVDDHPDLIDCIRVQIGNTVPVLVVLDTLNRSLSGSESKDEDMAAYVQAADVIRESFGCAVMIVHHCGIDGNRPRGHTSLGGAADAQLAVKRGTDGISTVTVEWMKDGAEGDEIAFKLERVEIGRDDDGEILDSCVVTPIDHNPDARPAASARKLSDRQQLAIKALKRTVADEGTPAPASFDLPVGVMVVPITSWRTEIGRSGAIAADATNPREDFRRLKDALQARNLIAVRDDLVWPL